MRVTVVRRIWVEDSRQNFPMADVVVVIVVVVDVDPPPPPCCEDVSLAVVECPDPSNNWFGPPLPPLPPSIIPYLLRPSLDSFLLRHDRC